MRTANGSVEIFVVFVALDIWTTCGNEHACVTVQVVHVECFFLCCCNVNTVLLLLLL